MCDDKDTEKSRNRDRDEVKELDERKYGVYIPERDLDKSQPPGKDKESDED